VLHGSRATGGYHGFWISPDSLLLPGFSMLTNIDQHSPRKMSCEQALSEREIKNKKEFGERSEGRFLTSSRSALIASLSESFSFAPSSPTACSQATPKLKCCDVFNAFKFWDQSDSDKQINWMNPDDTEICRSFFN